MNKHQKLAPNQGLVPRMTTPKFSLKDFLKKLEQRRASVQYRHDIIAATNRQNYMNEYDRIAGLLHNSVTHRNIDHNRLLNRQAELKHLYDQSFNTTTHGITKK